MTALRSRSPFLLAAETIRASVTIVTSGSWWAAMNELIVGNTVVVSVRHGCVDMLGRMRARSNRMMARLRTVPVAVRVIAVAAAVAGVARILVADVIDVHDPAFRIGLAFVAVLVGAPGILLTVGISALFCHYFVHMVRRYAPEHRTGIKRAARWLTLFLLVLALFVVAAVGWHGHVFGTAAWIVVRLLLAVALGGGTVLLALWPYFLRGASARQWFVAAIALLWGVGGVFLFAMGQVGLGALLVLVFAGVLVKFVKEGASELRRGGTDFTTGFVALVYLAVFGALWFALAGHAAVIVARWAGETALVGVLGTATAIAVWRDSRGARPIPRRLAAAGAVVVCACLLFLLFDGQVFGGPLSVVIFPLLLWQAIRLWRWMGDNGHLVIKAGADVVFALALGSTLVLLLIWLADLLAMPPAEVTVIKHVASAIGGAVDLSPWLWAGSYAALAAAYLVVAIRPNRFQRLARRLASARAAPILQITHRATTMTWIGLMVVALLGLVVPPVVGPILARQLRVTYTVAAQEELDAEQASAVYQAITTQFAGSRLRLPVLAALLMRVHDAEPPDKDTGQPSPTELDLAHRIGLLQGKLLANATDPAEQPSIPPDLAGPVHDADDLRTRLTEHQQQDSETKKRQKQAETAADLAASTVTSLLDLVGLGHPEALKIVHEYLDGLAESPLGKVFLSWTQRAITKSDRQQPPTAAQTVEPDATELAVAAQEELFVTELNQWDGVPPVPHPDTSQQSLDDAVSTAVHSEDQAGQVQEEHSCPACTSRPGENGHDQPGAPNEPEPPEEHGFR